MTQSDDYRVSLPIPKVMAADSLMAPDLAAHEGHPELGWNSH